MTTGNEEAEKDSVVPSLGIHKIYNVLPSLKCRCCKFCNNSIGINIKAKILALASALSLSLKHLASFSITLCSI